jgi:hypothetical protein
LLRTNHNFFVAHYAADLQLAREGLVLVEAVLRPALDGAVAALPPSVDTTYTRASDASEAPGWLTQANVASSEFVPFCWVQKGGTTRQVRSAVQRTERDPTGFRPTQVHAEFVDDHDEKYTVTGEVVNMVPFHWMQNNLIRTCLTRYDCNGRKGWGNFAESLENDVVRELLP